MHVHELNTGTAISICMSSKFELQCIVADLLITVDDAFFPFPLKIICLWLLSSFDQWICILPFVGHSIMSSKSGAPDE